MLHHLMHPTGWWIVLDILLFGASLTGAIMILGGDDDGWDLF
jgi:hypothetical protein